MGDIADWLMSNELDEWEDSGPRFQDPSNVRCKYCGETHLRWAIVSHGWRLVSRKNTIHSCGKYKK
jgi:hypothetical protein